jgi:hypothetical protein
MNNSFKHVLYRSSLPALPPRSDITICDKDIYNMSYNMETIKKRVHQLFIHPDTTCHYFASIGITNLNLTTYNEVIHEQAKICFKILGDFESSHKITYAVFAGNSIGLLRAGNNLPWADDYDIILFKHHVALFTSHIVPELERIGFKVKPKIVNGIACGAKIFGPPVSFTHAGDKYQSISIFQCDVFYSYFDGNGFLKNCGGWGLYHQKNIPRSVVFPLKRHQFHGMLLPFFNDSLKETELCYGDIQKCAIFSHHLDSTIFYKRWQHAYKDFDHIKKTSIINTRQYIRNGLAHGDGDVRDETTKKTLLLTSCEILKELCDILFNDGKCDDFHISVSKKLDFLRHLHENSIGIIVISPLTKQRCKTHFALEDLKHKKKIDAADYNYNAPGLKIIGDHAADVKYYFPYIKIIYQENVDDAHGDGVHGEYALSPLFYKYIDVMRVTRTRYEQVYQNHLNAAANYGIMVPSIEIIESD